MSFVKFRLSSSALVLIMLLSACAGPSGMSAATPGQAGPDPNSTPMLGTQAGPDGRSWALPDLPAEDYQALPRLVSAVADIPVLTPDPGQYSSGNEDQGDGYALVSTDAVTGLGGDKYGFARYTIPGMIQDRPSRFSITLAAALLPGGDEELPLAYWIGLSDYSRNAWLWIRERGVAEEGENAAGYQRTVHPDGSETLVFDMNYMANAGDQMLQRFTNMSGLTSLLVITDAAQEKYVSAGNPQGLCGVKVKVGAIETLAVTSPQYLTTAAPFTPITAITPGSAQAQGKSASAVGDEGQVVIEWNHLSDIDGAKPKETEATEYKIHRKLLLPTTGDMESLYTLGSFGQQVSYTDPYILPPPQPSQTQPGPIPGAQYQYWVFAHNDIGWTGGDTRIIDVPLNPPLDFKASDGTDKFKVILTWTAQKYVLEYGVWRDTLPPTPTADPLYRVPCPAAGEEVTWPDPAVEDGEVHTYWICARNDYAVRPENPEGWGIVSEPNTGYIGVLDAPESLSATGNDSGDALFDRVTLVWSAVGAATQYQVFRDTQDSGGLISPPGYSSTTFDDTEDIGTADHTYWVRGLNAGGQAGGMIEDIGSRKILDAPGTPAASDGNSSTEISVQWGLVPGALRYQVYRDSQASSASPWINAPANSWVDQSVSDCNPHTYWVVAENSFTTSGFSPPDNGYLDALPTAALAATPQNGDAPYDLQFDASGSTDMDGGDTGNEGITLYEFDYTANGSYDASGPSPVSPSHNCATRGRFTCMVRVSDAEGNTDTTTIDYGEWRGDWWCYGHDRQHTCRSSYLGPPNNSLADMYSAHPVMGGAVIGLDGEIYVGAKGRLVALHPDGSFNWEYTAPSSTYDFSTPAIATDGTIYANYEEGSLVALHPNGSLAWAYAHNQSYNSSPAVALDGTIYISIGYSLAAVNPDGSEKWTYPVPDGGDIPGNAAVGPDGTIYFGTQSTHEVIAVNPNGTQQWRYDPNPGHSSIHSSPSVDSSGAIYIGCDSGYLYKIKPDGSGKFWQNNCAAGGAITCTPALDSSGGWVYVTHQGTSDRGLFKFSQAAGLRRLVWTTVGVATGEPILDVTDNIAYFGDGNRTYWAIDVSAHADDLAPPYRTGEYIWKRDDFTNTGDRLYQGAIRDDQALFIGNPSTSGYTFQRFNGP